MPARLAFMLLCAVALAGCGGGGGQNNGPSLIDEYQKALNSTNPEAAVRDLVRVAYRFNTAKDVTNAERAANAASAQAGKITDPVARAAAFNSVASIQGTLRIKSATQTALKEVERACEKIETPEDKSASLAYMAASYGRYLDEVDLCKHWLSEAEKIAEGITAPAAKSKAMLAVANHANRVTLDEGKAATQRMIAGALAAAEGTPDLRARADALADLAASLDKMKRADDAKSTYEKAVAAATSLPADRTPDKCHALVNIADRMAKESNRVAEANKVLAQAEGFAEQVTDPALRPEIDRAINKLKSEI